ncbi:tetratricopeptide repeat protein [soil metagenome]
MTKNVVERSRDFFSKAYQFQVNGDYKKAIENYLISIDLFPTPEAYTYLGWAYSLDGNLEKAIDECKNSIDLDPEYGNPYNDIGAYLISQKKYDDAIPYLEMAINSKRYENFHFAHYNLGRVFESKGLWFEALDEYRTAFMIEPNFIAAKTLFNRLQGLMN